jgi:hypothetical protein
MRQKNFYQQNIFRGTLVAAALFMSLAANSQQFVIARKDDTRPDARRQIMGDAKRVALVPSSFKVTRYNGFNQIDWAVFGNDLSNRVSIEYSLNGVDFIAAGPVSSTNGAYTFKHYLADPRAVLYRVRIEGPAGRTYTSESLLLDGDKISPIALNTNMIRGNMVNVNAQLPVEKVVIRSADGTVVFEKSINGAKDFIPLAIPSLNKGVYFITFTGKQWISTDKLFVE